MFDSRLIAFPSTGKTHDHHHHRRWKNEGNGLTSRSGVHVSKGDTSNMRSAGGRGHSVMRCTGLVRHSMVGLAGLPMRIRPKNGLETPIHGSMKPASIQAIQMAIRRKKVLKMQLDDHLVDCLSSNIWIQENWIILLA